MSDSLNIAIDGPVASGKTTVGRLVARRLKCGFLDTGIMYRAATLAALDRGVDLHDDDGLVALVLGICMHLKAGEQAERLLIDGEDVTDKLRDSTVERNVSRVSSVPGVRRALVCHQRRIASSGPIVMVGRDIGTVVLPDASVKVFLDASVEVRARRRHAEISQSGQSADYDQVKSDIARRDQIDTSRADSPLKPADDAIIIQTNDLGIDEIAGRIIAMVPDH